MLVWVFGREGKIDDVVTRFKQDRSNRVTNSSRQHVDDNLVWFKVGDVSHCITLPHIHAWICVERIGYVEVNDGDFVTSLKQAFDHKAAHKATAKCNSMTHSATSGGDPS
jgi:desulfoferrodoxin (superoxide reductase-like protein)